MYFYKYQSINALSLMMLKRGEVFFASSEELNDKHECRPKYLFQGSKEVWLRFIDYVLVELCVRYRLYPNPEEATKLLSLAPKIYKAVFNKTRKRKLEFTEVVVLLTESIPLSFTREFSHTERQYILDCFRDFTEAHLLKEMHEPKYICSFSTNAINPTMWGHYGNAEKGIVVIYESDDGYVDVKSTLCNLSGFRNKGSVIELGLYNNERLRLEEVKYSRTPAKINAFSRLIHKFCYTAAEADYDVPESLSSDVAPMEENSVGLVKFTDWKYEKEVRLFFPTYGPLPAELRCLQINQHLIKGIIFGASVSESDKRKVIAAGYHFTSTTDTRHGFTFFQAIESHDKYEIRVKPIGIIEDQSILDQLRITPMSELSQHQQAYMTRIHHEIEERN
ncbi:DUF2971 domain-containing protein [Agarivorans sp. JK6]|uniref:DUF2971 domain-containing protein n=1 Tax=Agarivorans sp. JK6 TaxID=2997426 RepID=UPI00387364F7